VSSKKIGPQNLEVKTVYLY